MNTSFEPKSQAPTQHNSKRENQNSKAYPSRTIVHAKLEMTEPGDHDEREADAMARAVVSGGKIARKISSGGSGLSGIAVSSQMESQLNHLQGGGQAMPEGLRSMMESGLGQDFGQVRLHTDNEAASMSSSIHAKAFTHGNDIYFNRGQFSPETSEGQRLVAHELTHVVQGTGKVGREDDNNIEQSCIPMSEINKTTQKYSENTCKTTLIDLRSKFTAITVDLDEILKEVDNEVMLTKGDGLLLASLITSGIGGIAAAVAVIPGLNVAVAAALGIGAGVLTLGGATLSGMDLAESKTIDRTNNYVNNVKDIIIDCTVKELDKYYNKVINGFCCDGIIYVKNDEDKYDEDYYDKIIGPAVDEVYNKFKNEKPSVINDFVRNINRARGIASIRFREPTILCDRNGYCTEVEGTMLAKVGQDFYVVGLNYPFVYSIRYKLNSKYPMPDNEGLKQAIERDYLSKYKDGLVPVRKPSKSITSYSHLEDFIACITDQSNRWNEDYSSQYQYNLVPKELVFSKEEAYVIARGFIHKSLFSSCVPYNVVNLVRTNIYSGYESEKEALQTFGEYFRSTKICNGVAESLSYDIKNLEEANKVHFESVGSNIVSSKQIVFLKYVFDQLDIDY